MYASFIMGAGLLGKDSVTLSGSCQGEFVFFELGAGVGSNDGTCHNMIMDEIEHQNLWAAEQRRRGTLALLGVQPLLARFNPPGARVARQLECPPGAEVRHGGSGSTQNEAIPSRTQVNHGHSAQGQTSSKAAQLRSEGVGTSDRASTQSEPNPSSLSLADTEAVAFQLLIVEAGSWLWLEQIEDSLIRREQLQLVEGMARAITQGAVNLKHHQFDWPLAEHAHLPKDAESAKQSVAGQLRRLARERQALGMILMGPACGEWVNVPPALTQIVIPSTLSMLEKPLLKREAWQVLKTHTPRS